MRGVEGFENVAVSTMLGHHVLEGGDVGLQALVADEDEERAGSQSFELADETLDIHVGEVEFQPVDQHKVRRLHDDLEARVLAVLGYQNLETLHLQGPTQGENSGVVGVADEHSHVVNLLVGCELLLLQGVGQDQGQLSFVHLADSMTDLVVKHLGPVVQVLVVPGNQSLGLSYQDILAIHGDPPCWLAGAQPGSGVVANLAVVEGLAQVAVGAKGQHHGFKIPSTHMLTHFAHHDHLRVLELG